MLLSLFVYIGIVFIIVLQMYIFITLKSSRKNLQKLKAENYDAKAMIRDIASEVKRIPDVVEGAMQSLAMIRDYQEDPVELECVTEEAVVYEQNTIISPRLMLEDDKCIEIAKNMDFIIKDKKKYTNPDLKIEEIANELGINRTYLSYAINKAFNQNFKAYLNHYRFETMKEMLMKKNDRNFDDIAIKCGFGSIDTLRRVVKTKTGMNIHRYKESLQEKNPPSNSDLPNQNKDSAG